MTSRPVHDDDLDDEEELEEGIDGYRCARCSGLVPYEDLDERCRCPACSEAGREEDERERVRGLLAGSGIPSRFRDRRLRRFRKEVDGEGFEVFAGAVAADEVGITRWNAAAARGLRDWTGSTSLLVVGPPGGGKTTLLASRVSELVADGLARVVWTSEAEVFDVLRADFKHRNAVIRTLVNAEVLVLDDLGSVLSPGAWRDDYEGILSRRYDYERPVVATSNRDLGGLATIFGERLASRFVEMFGGGRRVFEVRGYDWRTRRPHPTRGDSDAT